MADEPKVLKRFANLDIDGVPKPKRVRRSKKPSASTPEASSARSPAVPVRPVPTAPPPPTPPRRAPPVRRQQTAQAPPMRRPQIDLEVLGGAGGVIVIEADLSTPRDAYDAVPSRPPGVIPASRGAVRPAPIAPQRSAPIEITPLAARQIRLMAYQHGVSGSALRVLQARDGSLDFTFDDEPTRDDVVFLSGGIRVIVDERALASVRGTRVTYADVPGAAGFRIE